MLIDLMKDYVVAVSAFCIGSALLILGLNGSSVASFFSRPMYADTWSVSEAAINAWTYVPIGMAVVFLMAAVIAFAIKYYVDQTKLVRE